MDHHTTLDSDFIAISFVVYFHPMFYCTEPEYVIESARPCTMQKAEFLETPII